MSLIAFNSTWNYLVYSFAYVLFSAFLFFKFFKAPYFLEFLADHRHANKYISLNIKFKLLGEHDVQWLLGNSELVCKQAVSVEI